MKGLAVLFALVLAAAFAMCAPGSSSSDAGQIIAVSSLSGGLEIGRASTITIDLRNDAAHIAHAAHAAHAALSAPDKPDSSTSFGEGGLEALGIVAELQSREKGISVISGPQESGSLGPGENRSVEFTVRAEENAGIGIHPMELALSYSILSGIEATGEDGLPEMTFLYRDMSRTIPLEVEASLGPKIDLQEVRGTLASGSEAYLGVSFVNRGDSRADKLRAEIAPQGPFGCTACVAEMGSPGPGEEVQAGFRVFVNDCDPGDYALPLSLRYLCKGEEREEYMAALVQVQASGWSRMGSIIMSAAALMVMLLASGIYLSRSRDRKRRPKQKRRL